MKPGTSEYVAAHKRVRAERGLPDQCAACGGPATEWANLTGHYEDVMDYQSMCRSCHVRMDKRRVHDEREDHQWIQAPYDAPRCHVCLKRNKRRAYHRLMQDPTRAAHRRALNRVAVRRYRARIKGVMSNV